MASVEVTISGVLYDKVNRTSQNVVLIGEAMLTGLGVGGGPMPPGSGGGNPPGIWGPTDPRPTPPIALPPGYPGKPPGIWGPTDPRPTPPIYLPPAGPVPPDPGDAHPEHPIVLPPDEGERAKLIEWKTAWSPGTGWVVVGIPNVPHPVPSS